ncbi:MAG: hypothetical protein IPL40_09200 [Proteobacteria bacterium]|nr:hypothetical protein [Pseudomonadota bacterium]
MASNGFRYRSALLVALWLSAPLASALHAIASSSPLGRAHVHRYCGQHRTIEEGPAAARQAPSPAPQQRSALLQGSAAHGGDDHASCPLADRSNLSEKLRHGVRGISAGFCGRGASRGPWLPAPAADRSTGLLRVAPKTSPPLV